MSRITIKIKTWSCACGYKQDFEPTQENMDLNFNNVQADQCPNCLLQGKEGLLRREMDPTKRITKTIVGDEEVDNHPKLSVEQKLDLKNKRIEDITFLRTLEDKD